MVTHETASTATSVELEFRVRDSELFFVRASERVDCWVALAEMIHRSDGQLLEYFTVEGAAPDSVLSAAADAPAVTDARLVREEPDGGLFEFVVAGPCIGGTLAETEAVVREVVAVEGVGRVVADVPPHADVREAVESVEERHGAELVARRERDRAAPDFRRREFRARLVDRLTARQLESLRTAYASGYFDWPRESTAEECAEAMGIAQPTFAEHVRAGEHKLVSALFDESRSRDAPDLSP